MKGHRSIFLLVVLCSVSSIQGCLGGSSFTNTVKPAIESQSGSIGSLEDLTEELYNANTGGVSLGLNPRGPRLITEVPSSILELDTTEMMEILLNVYRDGGQNPGDGNINNFLDALMNTEVMNTLNQYLQRNNAFQPSELRATIKDIWFTTYRRGSNTNYRSSGFRHTFVGEIIERRENGIIKKEVCGFHSWLNYWLEQERIVYQRYYRPIISFNNKEVIMNVKFKWNDIEKKSSSTMFFGTTPELAIALYTVCFITMPNNLCPVRMAGENFKIQTYVQYGTTVIGSAFPVIPYSLRRI